MRSPLKWNGGKSRLCKKIIEHFPPHTTYIEPFCGAAWVLFEKTPSDHEVINDTHNHLINFFKTLKSNPEEIIAHLEYELPSRYRHDELVALSKSPEWNELPLTEQAAYFYAIIFSSFGGNYQASFGTGKESPNRLNLVKAPGYLLEAHKRIQRVTIENVDYKRLKKTYDHPDALFYIDPPYLNTNCSAYGDYTFDHREFAEWCKGLEGRAIISHNRDEEFLQLFSDSNFQVIDIGLRQAAIANQSGAKMYQEVILKNF